MSAFERVFGVLKTALLMNERFDRIEADLQDLSGTVKSLGSSHADLAERVAHLEGFIEGAAAATGREPRLPKE